MSLYAWLWSGESENANVKKEKWKNQIEKWKKKRKKVKEKNEQWKWKKETEKWKKKVKLHLSVNRIVSPEVIPAPTAQAFHTITWSSWKVLKVSMTFRKSWRLLLDCSQEPLLPDVKARKADFLILFAFFTCFPPFPLPCLIPMFLILQDHVTVLVLNLFKPWNLSSGKTQSPFLVFLLPPFLVFITLTQWSFALQKDAWLFSNEFHTRTSQSSKSISWHYLSSSSLKSALYRTIIWKFIGCQKHFCEKPWWQD